MLKRSMASVVAGALVLTACGAGEEREERTADAPVQNSVEATSPTPGVLASINRSGVRGSARITRQGEDLLVVVDADSLEPGTRYSAAIHEGGCAEGGPLILPLGDITGGGDGGGSLRFRTAAEEVVPEGQGDLFVQIHAPDDRAVACANVEPEERAL